MQVEDSNQRLGVVRLTGDLFIEYFPRRLAPVIIRIVVQGPPQTQRIESEAGFLIQF
jgi:hypothetical protein